MKNSTTKHGVYVECHEDFEPECGYTASTPEYDLEDPEAFATWLYLTDRLPECICQRIGESYISERAMDYVTNALLDYHLHRIDWYHECFA